MEAEAAAREAAAAQRATYLSPYNDVLVAGGQGTVALELLAALPPACLGTVFVPVGGGGLIAGVAAVLKTVVQQPGKGIRVVGCQPAASDVMRRYVFGGTICGRSYRLQVGGMWARGGGHGRRNAVGWDCRCAVHACISV